MSKYNKTRADRKYRFLTQEEAVEGLECYKWTIGEFDTMVDFFGPNRRENSDNYHLWNDNEWTKGVMTAKEAHYVKIFTGDLRNGPGNTTLFLRHEDRTS